MSDSTLPAVTGVVLAGGRASRMGGVDKGLVEVADQAMVDHVLARLGAQTSRLIINANRNEAEYRQRGYPVVADRFGSYAGPLAGMAAGLAAAATPWVVTVPCDSPLVPPDLVARLWQGLGDHEAQLAVAWAEGRMQPVFALLPRDLLPDLEAFLESHGRKIDQWYARHHTAVVDLSDHPEAFVNINTPEDRSAMAARLQDQGSEAARGEPHE